MRDKSPGRGGGWLINQFSVTCELRLSWSWMLMPTNDLNTFGQISQDMLGYPPQQTVTRAGKYLFTDR